MQHLVRVLRTTKIVKVILKLQRCVKVLQWKDLLLGGNSYVDLAKLQLMAYLSR